MSDTPRTDAHTRQLIDTLQHPHWIEFARTLERENAALLKRLESSDQWDDYNSIKTLQRENAELRAALTRIRDCDWVITLPDRMDAVRDIARKALQEVQP